MDVDHSKTRVIDKSHCFEVGRSSWDDTETSIRCRYDNPETGRFSPHGSSELPLHDLQPLIEVASENDLLSTSQCAAMIQALAASIKRQSAK